MDYFESSSFSHMINKWFWFSFLTISVQCLIIKNSDKYLSKKLNLKCFLLTTSNNPSFSKWNFNQWKMSKSIVRMLSVCVIVVVGCEASFVNQTDEEYYYQTYDPPLIYETCQPRYNKNFIDFLPSSYYFLFLGKIYLTVSIN